MNIFWLKNFAFTLALNASYVNPTVNRKIAPEFKSVTWYYCGALGLVSCKLRFGVEYRL